MFNKKAEEKYLSPWNFFIWGIVLVIIVIALAIFNTSQTDVRKEEARIIGARIIDCIKENGFLRSEILNESVDLAELCSLNKETIENGNFYIELQINEPDVGEPIRPAIIIGNSEIKDQCEIKHSEKQFAFCNTQETYLQNPQTGKTVYVKVLAGSDNKAGIQ